MNSIQQSTSKSIHNIHYHGFSLQSVCWGYRDIFKKTIEHLFDEGLIGDTNKKVSREFFTLLKQADQSGFDYLLKEFLGSINPRTKWIMELPGIFSEVTNMGKDLAASKLYYGISFFKILGEGGFGQSPASIRTLINHMRRLLEIDEELAYGFMKGYSSLLTRLTAKEIAVYINEGLKILQRDRIHAIKFMEATTKSSENIIKGITRECRLSDVQPLLSNMLRALVGYKVEIANFGQLDSDVLIESGASLVCMYKWIYMPLFIRHFHDTKKNRQWYLLMNIVCAAMLSNNSFPKIHGQPEYPTCKSLVGNDILNLNLFHLIEFTRITNNIRQKWPGARSLLEFGIQTEFTEKPPRTIMDHILKDCLSSNESNSCLVKTIRNIANTSVNVFETASFLSDDMTTKSKIHCPELANTPLRSISFFPDFFFPGKINDPQGSLSIADLKEKATSNKKNNTNNNATATQDITNAKHTDQKKISSLSNTVFTYDEWCHSENDYYTDYCQLREMPISAATQQSPTENIYKEIKQVRQIFERLKPDITNKEKHLPDGDFINTDILVDYLTNKHIEPQPRIDFYEKPLINKRDIAVLMLLDISGSTGERATGKKILDIEKRAALIFAEGLASLGDNFSVCGFSGSGRKNCEYFVYKDFSDTWNTSTISRLLSAHPRSSTRIGVALRHSQHRMANLENKQRLIIIITDGKPMDNMYDPGTRYAQYDVRMACQENLRKNINTFAISTTENTQADMEIMFPRNRFVILQNLEQLSRILPQLYIKMTI